MNKAEVFIVLQNADFTEGRGPMILHSVWWNFDDAKNFVMDQYGIMGSQQYLRKEGDLTNSEKGIWVFNGYDIKRINVFDLYIKDNFDKDGRVK